MSLILKGIDLPTDENKPLMVEIWASGTVWEEIKGDFMCLRNSAIQIPKEHGRIGDIDHVEENIINYGDLPTEYLHIDFVVGALEDAPYLLEAEGIR